MYPWESASDPIYKGNRQRMLDPKKQHWAKPWTDTIYGLQIDLEIVQSLQHLMTQYSWLYGSMYHVPEYISTA